MGTVNNKQASEMSDLERVGYCSWCWFKDYGDCDNCALFRRNQVQPPSQTNKSLNDRLENPPQVDSGNCTQISYV